MHRKICGFTVVELLTTIAVLGLLVILSFLYIPAQVAKARDADRKGDVDLMGKFIEEYYLDTGCYPVSIPTCRNSFVLGNKIYLQNIPCDPKTANSYVYVSEINSCPKWFQLYGNLEYSEDKIIDVLGCRNGCGPKCQFNYGVASSNVKLNPFCIESTPAPTAVVSSPTSSPTAALQYACAPGGGCEIYANPELSGCPDIYLNDPTCQNQCGTPKNRCHDARGKIN